MNRKVHLLGNLSQFGEVWDMEAKSIADVVQLIDCQEQGFRKFLIDAAESGLDMAIVGKDFRVEEPDELLFENLGPEEVYISLVPAGSKKGWGKILLAVVLIATAILMPGGFLAAGAEASVYATTLLTVGISIGLQGITQLLAKTPDGDDQKTKEGLFDGPTSTLKQGQPVPVLYGELLIGGAPIHVDLTTSAQSRLYPNPTGAPMPEFTIDAFGALSVNYSDFYSADADPFEGWAYINTGDIGL
jgi:predicted phage tail protein